MAERTRPARFPRGVADTTGGRAFLRDQAGTLLALDLTSGRILWRTTRPMRPLLAPNARVVAIRVAAQHTLELLTLDASDGRELGVSKPLVLPEWMNVSLEDSAEFKIGVEAEDGMVVLRWDAHARYRGGAAPGAKVLEAARRDGWGEARVDADTLEIKGLVEDSGEAPEPLAQETLSSASPDVLERQDLHNRSFQLLARSTRGVVQMLVRAVDSATGQIIWETVIGETVSRRPKPLRP
ncbi:MAG: PQQ-binding-like beta-propeller repeat protein [Deltaproteobacteria bacterium]|nr:PQQ-binding-like beta-propeller repeat protein [Deltaproteobacteria bacterium]